MFDGVLNETVVFVYEEEIDNGYEGSFMYLFSRKAYVTGHKLTGCGNISWKAGAC